MSGIRFLFHGLAALPMVAVSAFAAQTYTAADLGSLGAVPLQDLAINSQGRVIGTFLVASNPHAFLYSSGTLNDLGTLANSASSYSIGYGVNQAGQVVGVSGISNGTFQAFLYSDGSLINLDPDDFESAANAINSLGQAVGYVIPTSSGTYYAAMFNRGQVINLGAIPGGTACQAQEINNQSQVVGFCDFGGNNHFHAFLYSQGRMLDIGTLAGSSTSFVSQAYALNERGQVAGYSDVAGGGTHAFLYTEGAMTDLGVLAGYTGSVALAVNNLGQVVGYAFLNSTTNRAFLYSGGTTVDLNSLVTMPAGVSLISAEGINDSGQIIALGSNNHAYLLSLAPSTLTVLNPFAPYAITDQAPPTLNIAAMITAPSPAQSLAADGQSAVVLEYVSPSSQPVTFTLSAPGTQIPVGASPGSLGAFVSSYLVNPQPTTGTLSLKVSTPSFGAGPDGKYVFLALLWAPSAMPVPDAFPAVPLLAAATQQGQPAAQANINLEPPPLLLVHGIWSSAAAADFTPGSGGFYDYVAGLYPHSLIFPLDYSAIATRSFNDSQIQNIFLAGIEDALAGAAQSGMAARTVDVVAHSSGGLVARYFATKPISQPNLLANSLHNVITVGTPHQGTALATALVNNTGKAAATAPPEVAAWCAFTATCNLGGIMTAMGQSPAGGGAAAIEPASSAIAGLSSSNVFRAISGNAPSPASTTESLLNIVLGAYLSGQTASGILGATGDTLSITSSQDPPGAADSAPAIPGVLSRSLCGDCNTAETASPSIWAQAYYWLTGGKGINPPNGRALAALEPRSLRPEVSVPAPLLNLTGYTQVPATNVTFQPATGANLSVNNVTNITATSGTKTITEVLLFQTAGDPADIPFLYATQSPFSIAFTPVRLGTANFAAVTVFNDNTYALTALTYNLQTSGFPYALSLLNLPVGSMAAGSSRVIAAQAMFANGPVIVTSAATYVTQSGSTGVISAAAGGTVTANAAGVDGLKVSYGGLTVTAPIAVGTCTYALSPANQIVSSAGGAVSIQVATQAGCMWTASGGASWLTFTQAGSTGSGTITLTAAANSSGSAQGALVTVNGMAAIITQPSGACTYNLVPTQINAPSGGVSGSIGATTTCPVTASSNQSWLVASPAGSAVAYSVMPNYTTSARSAVLTIGTVNVPVNQAAYVCAVAGNGVVGVSDVQKIVNEALGTAAAGNDLNGDKVVNIADAQIVINAAMGLACTP